MSEPVGIVEGTNWNPATKESLGFVGCDVSVLHSGLVEINKAGKLSRFAFLTNRKTTVEKTKSSRHHGRHVVFPAKTKKNPDKESREAIRLLSHTECLKAFFFHNTDEESRRNTFVTIEDYAFHSQSQNFSKAEIQGTFKAHLYKQGYPIRLHDPTSLKLFMCNNGHAEKEEVQLAMIKQDPKAYMALKAVFDREDALEDLCDAWGLARMAWLETLVRKGHRAMKDLKEGERRVFNRTTKTKPINLLERPFAQVPERS